MDGKLVVGSTLDLISQCWRLNTELTILYDDVVNGEDGLQCWTVLSNRHAWAVEGIVFPLAFNFHNLDDANTMLMIWSTQTILWHGMTQLYGLLEQLRAMASEINQSEMISLPPLTCHMNYVTAAFNIFQAAEYCLKDEFLDFGPKSIAAPLRIAIDTLKIYSQYEREISWGRAVLRRIQTRGLRILNFWVDAVEDERIPEAKLESSG